MQKYHDKIKLSHLLHYAYRWFITLPGPTRDIIESEEMIHLWAIKSLRDYKHRHVTVSSLCDNFMKSLPQIDQDFDNCIMELKI